MNQKKLILPLSIIVGCIILGGFIYASQINKQRSIERQQVVELEEGRRIEKIKAEQEHKEYVAKRKLECYELFLSEQKRVNNAENFGYIEIYTRFDEFGNFTNIIEEDDYRDDTCEIIYKDVRTGEYFRRYY